MFAAAANVIFVLVTARVLGPSDRGRLVVITTSAGLVSILCAMGVGSAGRHLLASPELSNLLPFRRYTRLVGLLGAVSGAFNVGVLALLGPSLGLPAGNALLVLGGMLATLMTVSTLLIDAMNSYGLTARSSLVAANVGLVGLLAFVGLIQILDNELTAAVAGTAGGFATSCVMAAWLLRRTPKPEGGVRTEFDLLRAGVRLAPFLVWPGRSAPT